MTELDTRGAELVAKIMTANDRELLDMRRRVAAAYRKARDFGVESRAARAEATLLAIENEINNRRPKKAQVETVAVEFISKIPPRGKAHGGGRREAAFWQELKDNPRSPAIVKRSKHRWTPEKRKGYKFTTRKDPDTGEFLTIGMYTPPRPLSGAALAAKEGRLKRDDKGRIVSQKSVRTGPARDSKGRFLPKNPN